MKPIATTPEEEGQGDTLLETLFRECGLTNKSIAEHIGHPNPTVLSQWKTGARPVPAIYAPKLAAVLGVRPEVISAAYADLLRSGCLPMYGDSEPLPPGHVAINRMHGFGRENGPHFIVLPRLVVDMKIGDVPFDQVRWVQQPTGAMMPTIPQGAVVLVNIGVCTREAVVDGGLYAYTLYGRPYVRRVLVGRNAWALCGHDESIERVVIKAEDLDDLRVYGAVLGWL